MDDRELSAEDLREKLFHTFRNRGVLDSLKSQLRNRLVTELQQTAKFNLSNGKKKPPDLEESSLFYHAANSLVVDHLERCNLEYTMSVFLPESGTSKDKLLTIRDLLHLLKIDKDSYLYKSLEGSSSSKINPKSFLWEIMSQLLSQCGQTRQSTITVQTEESASMKSPSIAEKLKLVDQAFSERAEKENEAWGSQAEQKIAEFQRKCEERKKAELDAEIKQYKTSALASMRLEEKQRCEREIKIAKEQMEKDYSLKAEMLRLKEKELTDLQHRQQKIQEEEAYSQRQNILQEMQAAKDRENEFKMRQELHLKTIQLEEERLKNEAEKIKARELALKEEEKRSQQKIEDEIQRYKLQHQEGYQKRLHDLELREAQLKQDKESFERSKSTYLGYYDELEGKKEQLRESQNQFEATKYNIATLQQQKDTLLQKLDEVKDYRKVKDNELTLQKEKDELQKHFEEQSHKEKANKEMIKELKDKLSKPSAELVSVRNELKAVKDDAKNKEKLHKDKQRKLEARLQQESQRCAEYQRLYEEHLLRQKEMEHELDDLRAALHHTQEFLRMEMARKRRSETSVSDIHDLTVPSPLVQPTPGIPATSIPFAPSTNQHGAEADNSINDTANTQELIANTKEIFEKLEKEAKDFEESYRRFQSRMKNTGLDQFTSLPPVSLDRHTSQGYPGRHAEIIEPQLSLGIDTNIDKADEFVPLSWIPATEKTTSKMPKSLINDDHMGGSLDPPPFPSSLLPSTRQGNNTDSLTRFYSLPSFGVSEVTPSFSVPRYFGLSRTDTRPPNNTVNVSDLIAKPGSPSVISAPIDHSPMDSNTDASKGKKARERPGDSSTDTMRRPLSSTIDRAREGTGMGSRENDFLTSASSQRNSDHNSHVPVIDGSVFYGRKSDVDKDLSEQDSHRSSDASLSGGYLSMGTLSKPSRTQNDTKKTTKTHPESTEEKQNDEVDAYNIPAPTRISLDSAWGVARGDDAKDKDEQSSLSIDSNPSLPSIGEKVSVPLDSVWKDAEEKRVREEQEREKREREERVLREQEEREWEEEKRKREEQRRQREQEAREREQRELEELQREQELREREKHADNRQKQTETSTENENKKPQESSKDPEIDPVMLQYMQMIRKKKEEEEKAKVVEHSKKESREAADTTSNSLLSQGDDNLGSIEELTDDDGFDWG